jgi:hypothetical protein
MAICRCKSRTGKQKYRYHTWDEADITARARGWKVDIYACPSRKHTFHITHAASSKKKGTIQ